MKPIRRHAALLCLLGLVAGAAWSQPSAKGTLSDWNSRLQTARTHLLAGKHRQALEVAVPLQSEMLNAIQDGPGSGSSLARVVLLRAVAEAGVGEMNAAAWDWYVAQTLDPTLMSIDLSPFGPAGEAVEALGPLPVNIADLFPPEGESTPCDPGQKVRCPGVERPHKVAGAPPKYPEGLIDSCLFGEVVIQTVIDEQGAVRHPVVTKTSHPLFALAALESARSWRFLPASYKGRAVKAFYSLTFNFSPQDSAGCKRRH